MPLTNNNMYDMSILLSHNFLRPDPRKVIVNVGNKHVELMSNINKPQFNIKSDIQQYSTMLENINEVKTYYPEYSLALNNLVKTQLFPLRNTLVIRHIKEKEKSSPIRKARFEFLETITRSLANTHSKLHSNVFGKFALDILKDYKERYKNTMHQQTLDVIRKTLNKHMKTSTKRKRS